MVFTHWEPTPDELYDFYKDYPPIEDIPEITLKRYDELLDRMERFRSTGKILDIGCGAGHFLERAMKRGWETSGTEFGERPIAACLAKGINIRPGDLDPSHYAPRSFDVVCMFEVFEHLTDPSGQLEKIKHILRPGGLLYITVPNFNSISRRTDIANWSIIHYPEHLNHFTPKTLGLILRRHGFKREWIQTSGVSIERWMNKGQKTKQERERGWEMEQSIRENLENRWYLNLAKRALNKFLDLTDLGDSLKAGYILQAGSHDSTGSS